MLDLDDFKVVNDTFGHVYGDGVLVHVAELIRGTLRASDVAARYGGDEFALILPETGRDDAAAVADRILAAFQGSPFVAHGRQPFAIGASMGVATHPRDGYSATTLIAAADVALYDAKDLGGNRFATGTATHDALAEAAGRLARPVGRGRDPREVGEPIGMAPVRSGEA
jgi:diguanylate cyclase (GGDEF)-like protein